jgi:hypothetical protein
MWWRRVSSHAIAVTGYCVALAAVAAVVVASYRPESRIPTAGRLVASIRSTYVGRVLLVLGWGWVGWHFFVR